MTRIFVRLFGVLVLSCLIILNSCRRDVGPSATPIDISYTQSFDSIQGALNQGWVIKNNSRPLGVTSWFQGVFAGFPGSFNSYTGADYIAANYQNATVPSTGTQTTISNWLITPSRPVKNGDVISFYTRTYASPSATPDRLELRLNTTGNTEVGNDSASVGDFTKLVLSINPTVTSTGYPATWTQYTYSVAGLAAPKTDARFAFRYYKTLSPGAVGGYIGIDEVTFTSVK